MGNIAKSAVKLSVFSVIMITVTSVDSIRNLPGAALFGSHAISYFLLAGFCFFVPTALVCAELSTTYPKQGGVYLWGKETLGHNFGFVTVWYQYAENIVYYPPLISFIVATGTYPFFPHLAENNIFMLVMINVIFWALTIVNIYGLRLSSIITNVFGTFGLIFPILLIIALGAYWTYTNPESSHISLRHASDWLPDFSQSGVGASFTAVVLSLTGIEITTAYASEVKNPQKAYPKALLISTVLILISLTACSLSIAAVVSSNHSSLSEGVILAFKTFFEDLNMPYLLPIIALAIVFGSLASLNNWIIAPTKSLHVAAQDKFMPIRLAKENENQAPVPLLLLQGAIVSLLSLVFILVPNVNQGMWLLNILMTQLYMVMYICIFISFLVSRRKHKDIERPFRVPGGKFGMIVAAVLGLFSCVVTIIVSFDVPAGISKTTGAYALIIGFIVFSLPAIFAIKYRKKHAA
ncbi:TPA: APC family permease [Photobacterium damselae]|uniref:Amino acid permease n=3 Tax=Photobacterium damselae TaxID=38293 RepID=A0A4S2JKL9_PHODD|nr:APC family permease [Photobacterium damselae]EEZ41309.1 putative amino acid transporter [Photobacterium damselae subsp. damselae CIP 102761]EHA1080252.1 amino acid permease [Photobacterium damselae]KAB1178794.1 amino acid permease [Photobacterium damselae subsp. damselae]KAB1183891.1 amino acid permease [Photobacterium damselae subsp. damselae]MBA5683164.1 amino acid permease [Photobacterium damselae subsp. damselae]